jgi:hypothetical protein
MVTKWKRNGNEQKWNGNGMEMEWEKKWKHVGNGMETGLKWNGNGMEMEWKWKRN